MNRAVAASLAAVVVGTGLAIGQTGRSTSDKEEPTPPSTVIRTGPTDRPAFGTKPNETPKEDDKKPQPKKRTPPPYVIRNAQRLEEPTPPPTVIRKDAPKSSQPKKTAEPKLDVVEKPAEPKSELSTTEALSTAITPKKVEEVKPAVVEKPKQNPVKTAPERVTTKAEPRPIDKSMHDALIVEKKPTPTAVQQPIHKKDSAASSATAQITFPIRPSAYAEQDPVPPVASPITIGQPTPPPIVPSTPPEVKEIKPPEKSVEIPAPEMKPVQTAPLAITELPANAVGRYPSYATDLIQPHFPWTKMGRRLCGTVYVDTPYVWLDAQYLWGWTKQDHAVPLVTSGAVNSANRGALGDPGTTVLFDGQQLQDEPYHGGKFMVGGWLDECQYCGIEGGYFFFASQDRGFIAGDNGYPGLPGLYMPYFDPLSGSESAFAIADPGQASGVININSRTRVQGAEGHFLFSFARNLRMRMDALVGVRWLGLDEDLTIEQNIRQGPGNGFVVSSDVGVFDQFGTRTDFIGADIGFKTHFERNFWSLDILTRIAFGGNHQVFRGLGWTGITFDLPDFGTPVTQGGRYVGPANNGIFSNDRFAIVPEIGVTIGYMPTHWFKFTLGYNWVYWTDVIRVGAQVDRVINPIGVPTSNQYQSSIYEPRRPGVAFNESDIWLQSITLGMQFLY
jgi:hypothetical protein